MRARVLVQADVARRLNMDTANLSRMFSGKRPLSPTTRRALARVFGVTEAELLQPVGTPIPDSDEALRFSDDVIPTGVIRRIEVVLEALGLERLEEIVPFILVGDYSTLPPRVAKQFRDILEGKGKK
jgi:transcriptional regulator with XRE-family HTH domain